MHEYSLVQTMVDRIEGLVAEHGARSVRRVRVRVGTVAGVEPSLFETAYDICRVKTVCDDAPLQIVVVEGSDELVLDQVELEVP